MSFLTRHKTTVALVAILGLTAGAAHLVGLGGNCPLGCPFGSLFAAQNAYAGAGCCNASAKKGTCSVDSKETASVSSKSDKVCSKEECLKALMSKGMSKDEAEVAYAKAYAACHSDGHGVMTAAADGKTCAGNKEACVAKCMKEKGYTREQAEACYAKCQAEKSKDGSAAVITTAVATETVSPPSRDAYIDAMVARGMKRADAEAYLAKCEKDGMTAEAAVLTVQSKSAESKSAGCAAAKTCTAAKAAGCCAKRSAGSTSTATTTPAGGSN